MQIVIPIPAFDPHGGIRIIVDIANGLAAKGHEILMLPLSNFGNKNIWDWHRSIKFIDKLPDTFDRILITSPHSIHLEVPGKTLIHLQMMEHLFRPNDKSWLSKCEALYRSNSPLMSISKWNINMLTRKYGRNINNTFYIGNGVNFNNFSIERSVVREEKTILVEGWGAYNPCKDVDRLAPKVALKLKKEGFKIISYGLVPLSDYKEVVDEYHKCPDINTINALYRRAKFLLKASRYDARSCSPVEAMTKATPCVRALVEGDDDLIHEYNCLRTGYNEHDLFSACKRLIDSPGLYQKLSLTGQKYVQEECNWEKWIQIIEEHLKNV